ncbi:MAG: DUF805 domain-containing protein [Actinomycetota bacterium]|nr:DUF805 domain-containing protein [Actinomycetota bacterium]
MDLSTSVRYCLENYANFNGRAARPEFWWFYLAYAIVVGVPYLLGSIFVAIGTSTSYYGEMSYGPAAIFGWLLYILAGLVSLALIVPMLAVGSRRLHDTGKSGWFQVLLFVPCVNFIGAIILIIFWATTGTPGANSYGEAATA